MSRRNLRRATLLLSEEPDGTHVWRDEPNEVTGLEFLGVIVPRGAERNQAADSALKVVLECARRVVDVDPSAGEEDGQRLTNLRIALKMLDEAR